MTVAFETAVVASISFERSLRGITKATMRRYRQDRSSSLGAATRDGKTENEMAMMWTRGYFEKSTRSGLCGVVALIAMDIALTIGNCRNEQGSQDSSLL